MLWETLETDKPCWSVNLPTHCIAHSCSPHNVLHSMVPNCVIGLLPVKHVQTYLYFSNPLSEWFLWVHKKNSSAARSKVSPTLHYQWGISSASFPRRTRISITSKLRMRLKFHWSELECLNLIALIGTVDTILWMLNDTCNCHCISSGHWKRL